GLPEKVSLELQRAAQGLLRRESERAHSPCRVIRIGPRNPSGLDSSQTPLATCRMRQKRKSRWGALLLRQRRRWPAPYARGRYAARLPKQRSLLQRVPKTLTKSIVGG